MIRRSGFRAVDDNGLSNHVGYANESSCLGGMAVGRTDQAGDSGTERRFTAENETVENAHVSSLSSVKQLSLVFHLTPPAHARKWHFRIGKGTRHAG